MRSAAGIICSLYSDRAAARRVDTTRESPPEMVKRTQEDRGASLLEIHPNCIVYNDDACGDLHEKKSSREMIVRMKQGRPLTSGPDA